MDRINKHVLIVYYSFTQQTHKLIERYCDGLRQSGVQVELCCLRPAVPTAFPITSNITLLKRMWNTFLRERLAIKPPSIKRESYDHVVVAGPTWSYQPSGPILDFLDKFGEQYLKGTDVSFVISCRSYWRIHYWGIKQICKKHGAVLKTEPTIFQHHVSEPWCTIGLVLWLRGYRQNQLPEWFKKKYPHYGHTDEQFTQSYHKGVLLGETLLD